MEGGKETRSVETEKAHSVLVTCCILHKLTQDDETLKEIIVLLIWRANTKTFTRTNRYLYNSPPPRVTRAIHPFAVSEMGKQRPSRLALHCYRGSINFPSKKQSLRAASIFMCNLVPAYVR